MKKLYKLFTILLTVLSVSATAKADTSILKESEGWMKITEMPANLTDYYYALVDNSSDLMLTMALGAEQSPNNAGYYTMYYKNSVNPLQNKAALWTIEGSNYTFRNTEYTQFAMQTEWGAAWYYRTHDQPNACEWTATIPTYSLSEACWTIQNGRYPDSGYLGPWHNTVQEGAEVACNKLGDAIGKFQIYAIHKTYCVDVLADNATEANPVDMTVLLANVNADLPVVGMGGWTTANTIGRNGNKGYDGKDGFFEFCNWGSTTGWNGSMSQTITSIPNGKYKVKAAGQASADVLLTMTANGESVTLDSKGAAGGSLGHEGWEYIEVECLVTNGTLEILVNSSATTSQRWGNVDNFTLTYYGKDLSASIASLHTAIITAEGIDQTKLSAKLAEDLAASIASAQAELNNGDKTIDSLEEQLASLNTAIDNANAWIADYNNARNLLVAALERFETDFNDGANGALRFTPADAWSNILNAVAAAAVAKDNRNDHSGFAQAAADLHAAMDAVYASYIKYDILENYTSLIGNADCADNAAWLGSGRTTATGQHWSGDATRVYFTQNHENGAARSQTITLPKSGTYLLKVSVRAVEAASYVDIIINGTSHKTMGAHGRTGGTIATDGTEWNDVAEGIEAGKSFANGNKGYGWVYQYIYFDAKAGESTIAINLSNVNSNREANCGGMELYYLRPNYIVKEGNAMVHYGEYTETIATAHTTHDVTNATMSNLAVDVASNPNTIIIANEGQVSNRNNVVVDGTATSLVLTEGYAFNATTDFTANTLNYAREFSNNWLTVCLPFAYAIPENVKVETLGAVDLGTKTFTFNEVEGTIEANKPYIIKNSSETAALFAELNDVKVEGTPEIMAVEVTAENSEHKVEFIGTYTTMKTDALMENGTYDILFFGNDGQLYYLSSGITSKVVNIKPFRAYIRLPKGAINWSDGQQAIARHGEGTTSIDNAPLTNDNAPVIYDLQGRRVEKIGKGIYIVNGKKVFR